MSKNKHSSHLNDRGAVKSLLRSERGSTVILVAVSLVVIFAFAVLAVEGAILMTTRTQLQAAADAAALAAATGLLEGSEATAINRAINFASYNSATQVTSSPVVITAADVTFPDPRMVRVRTHRTRATGDAIRTYFVRILNPASDNQAEMTAVPAATVFDACGAQCLRPWAIPDRWADANANGVYDDGELYDPLITGYKAPGDVGASIVLKSGNPQQAIEPGIFYPVNYPPLDKYPGQSPLTGGDWYRQWIYDCTPYLIEIDDRLQLEPGNMVGPTMQGINDLIAQDPGARWDTTDQKIVNSAYGRSPRIGLVPLFDPQLPPTSGRNYVTISKIGAFFIESTGPGSQVNGRFVQITAQGTPCETNTGSSLVQGLQLIE
jgi:Flp pilus assembly protein TadG